jgi:S1-C subfamily serine protease
MANPPSGKKVKCPKCGTGFVPEEDAEETAPRTAIKTKASAPVVSVRKSRRDEDDEEEDDRPARKRDRAREQDDDDEDERPARKRARDDDDDEDDAPRRKKKKKAKQANSGLMIGLAVGGGVFALLLLGGLGFLLLGSKRADKAVAAANPPEAAPGNPAPAANQAQPAANPAQPAAAPVAKPAVQPAANPMAKPAATVTALPAKALEDIRQATAYIKVDAGDQGSGTGSGFLMKVNGDTAYVITNYHVVSPPAKEEQPAPAPGRPIGKFGGPKMKPGGPPGFMRGPGFGRFGPQQAQPKAKPKVTVVLNSGTPQESSLPAEVVAFDAEVDLAALRITGGRNLPNALDLTQEAQLVETMPLYIFGFPLGGQLAVNKGNPNVTIGKGSISSLRNDENNELAMVQINGDINPGNSGGPVVDSQGRLVGISVGHVPGTQIGAAIPAVELTQMLKGRVFGMLAYKLRQQFNTIDLNGEFWVFDRKNKVRGGDNLNLRFPDGGKKLSVPPEELEVEVRLTDPMHNISSVTAHFVQADNLAPNPNAQGLWDPLPGAQQVGLKIEDQRAHGSLQMPQGLTPDQKMAFQIAYVNAEGKALFTQPRVVALNFAKTQAGQPAPAAPTAGDAVTITITGIPDEMTRKSILATLPKLLDGGSHSLRSVSSKGVLTVMLSPVPDPQAFAAKITFGQATVQGRNITVVVRKM